ncbi:MAG: MFS transporter [Bacteroidales bacterium]|nr:MFS transporter [Candidatus Colimorpha onthohippi]
MKKLAYAILSLSALSILTGAAVAPALGHIFEHFHNENPLFVQLIASLPALFIIISSLLFPFFCKHIKLHTLSIIALCLYAGAGASCFLFDKLLPILIMRALLGISVGIIMPLTTGLIARFFPAKDQSRLMGYSASMNEFGALIATLVSGMLVSINWNYTFLIYLIGIIPLILVVCFVPNESLIPEKKQIEKGMFIKFMPCIFGMMLTMMLFFTFVINFANITLHSGAVALGIMTLLMATRDALALVIDLNYMRIARHNRQILPYVAPITFLIGFAALAYSTQIGFLIIGIVCLAIANGVGIPQLNTVVAIRGGKDVVTSVMPYMSIAFFLGEFLTPFVVRPTSKLLGGFDTAPYVVGIIIACIFLIHTFVCRNFLTIQKEDEQ